MKSNHFAALASLLLALAPAVAAPRPEAVVVINGTSAPVPVLVTNLQSVASPAPRSVVTNLFGSNAATVIPAPGVGKRFVVKHLNMFLSSNISGVPLTDANCVTSLHQGSTSFTIATYALQRASLADAMGLSQDEYLVLGPTDSLEMICLSNPGNSSGRATVSGDVLSGQ